MASFQPASWRQAKQITQSTSKTNSSSPPPPVNAPSRTRSVQPSWNGSSVPHKTVASSESSSSSPPSLPLLVISREQRGSRRSWRRSIGRLIVVASRLWRWSGKLGTLRSSILVSIICVRMIGSIVVSGNGGRRHWESEGLRADTLLCRPTAARSIIRAMEKKASPPRRVCAYEP
jgi:hypothetical protein